MVEGLVRSGGPRAGEDPRVSARTLQRLHLVDREVHLDQLARPDAGGHAAARAAGAGPADQGLAEGAARYRGVYKLQQRQANGRPTWRRAEGGDHWLAWGGHAWFVQGESSLGGSAGFATLSEDCWLN